MTSEHEAVAPAPAVAAQPTIARIYDGFLGVSFMARTRRRPVRRSGVLPAPAPFYPGNRLEGLAAALADEAFGNIWAAVDAAKGAAHAP